MINSILKLRKNTFFVLSSIIFSLINLRNIFYGNPIFDERGRVNVGIFESKLRFKLILISSRREL